MGKSENVIQTTIKEYLEWRGFWVIRVQCGQVRVRGGIMHLAKTGTSDLLTWLKDGRIFAIETKTEDGRLSQEQREFRDEVLKSGGIHVCARSIQNVEAVLKEVL